MGREVSYIAVNSLVTHHTDSAARVDGGISLRDLVIETSLANLRDEDLDTRSVTVAG